MPEKKSPDTPAEKPKTWPASPDDLGIDDPPITADEPFTYIPDSVRERAPGDTRNIMPIVDLSSVNEPTQTTPAPTQLGKPRNLAPSFSTIIRIDGEVHHFELSATGSADFIERITHAFGDAFADELKS